MYNISKNMSTFVDQNFQIFGYNSLLWSMAIRNFTKHFQMGIHNRVDSKKATIMYAKLLEGVKIKTADQKVTAPLIPLVGEAETVTSRCRGLPCSLSH